MPLYVMAYSRLNVYEFLKIAYAKIEHYESLKDCNIYLIDSSV